jgi:hypothetical protein
MALGAVCFTRPGSLGIEAQASARARAPSVLGPGVIHGDPGRGGSLRGETRRAILPSQRPDALIRGARRVLWWSLNDPSHPCSPLVRIGTWPKDRHETEPGVRLLGPYFFATSPGPGSPARCSRRPRADRRIGARPGKPPQHAGGAGGERRGASHARGGQRTAPGVSSRRRGAPATASRSGDLRIRHARSRRRISPSARGLTATMAESRRPAVKAILQTRRWTRCAPHVEGLAVCAA